MYKSLKLNQDKFSQASNDSIKKAWMQLWDDINDCVGVQNVCIFHDEEVYDLEQERLKKLENLLELIEAEMDKRGILESIPYKVAIASRLSNKPT